MDRPHSVKTVVHTNGYTFDRNVNFINVISRSLFLSVDFKYATATARVFHCFFSSFFSAFIFSFVRQSVHSLCRSRMHIGSTGQWCSISRSTRDLINSKQGILANVWCLHTSVPKEPHITCAYVLVRYTTALCGFQFKRNTFHVMASVERIYQVSCFLKHLLFWW